MRNRDARHIQPWPDAEADVHRTERRTQPRDFHERPHAGPARLRDALEPGADENAVLLHERHDIRDRADGREVEQLLDVEARERLPLQQRVRDLERDARAAQVVE